ncbi:MAG TPA: GNAT family protein [Ornithinibacter sp.]|nr:GNAT family protein [Ornithinibacter sp.]
MDAVPDFATKPTLRGSAVILRPFREGDAEVMAQILSDPEVRRLTGSVETTAQAQRAEPLDDRILGWYGTRNEQVDRLDLGIEDAATGRLVGEVVLNEVDLDSLSCNLRVLIGPEGRDRGLGTEAVGLATAHGIERLGLRRITLEVFEFNPRGRRVYEKVGYVVTGSRPGAMVFDGVAVGAVDMAVEAAGWAGFPAADGATGD